MHEFLGLRPQALPPRRFATEDSARMRLTSFVRFKLSAIETSWQGANGGDQRGVPLFPPGCYFGMGFEIVRDGLGDHAVTGGGRVIAIVRDKQLGDSPAALD